MKFHFFKVLFAFCFILSFQRVTLASLADSEKSLKGFSKVHVEISIDNGIKNLKISEKEIRSFVTGKLVSNGIGVLNDQQAILELGRPAFFIDIVAGRNNSIGGGVGLQGFENPVFLSGGFTQQIMTMKSKLFLTIATWRTRGGAIQGHMGDQDRRKFFFYVLNANVEDFVRAFKKANPRY